MYNALLVFVGGGAGAVMRYAGGLALARMSILATTMFGFPIATIVVNIVGSMLMGVLCGVMAMRGNPDADTAMRLVLATGVLGGFTTFSTFSLEAGTMLMRGQTMPFLLYVALSVIGCILAFAIGFAPFFTRGAGI